MILRIRRGVILRIRGGVILIIGLGFDSQNRGRDDSEFRIRLL